MAKHAETFQPSEAHRWLRCTGYLTARKACPPREETPAMARGTACHQLLELCLRRRLPAEAGLGRRADNGHLLDADDVRGVADALAWIVPRIAKAHLVMLERWVDIETTGEGGTCDLAWWDGSDALDVLDYKNGRVDVSARENPQLRLYADGALAALRTLFLQESWLGFPKRLRLHIAKPHARGAVDIVDTWETSVAVNTGWMCGTVAPAVAAHRNGTARLVPGDQCRGCQCFATCGTAHAFAAKAAALDWGVIPTDHKGHAASVVASAEEAAPPARPLADLLAAAPLFLALAKAAKAAAAHRLAADPASVPGWKLVEGRANRRWVDPAAAIAALEAAGVPPAVAGPRKPMGVPAALARLEDDAREKFAAQHVTKPRGKTSLAPESDPRPALGSNAAADFADDIEDDADE